MGEGRRASSSCLSLVLSLESDISHSAKGRKCPGVLNREVVHIVHIVVLSVLLSVPHFLLFLPTFLTTDNSMAPSALFFMSCSCLYCISVAHVELLRHTCLAG